MDVALLLHSAWLLPALALLVALDGPFPVVPSEPLLMTASAVAIGAHDLPMALGLFAAAFAGSVAGDHLLFALGRTSRRFVGPGSGGIAGWVQRNISRRPAVTIVGARFVPAGRLVSTTAAGRYGVSPRRFLPCSLVSSALWAGYMMGIGLLLGPLTGGDPLRGLVAGIAMGALTAGAFALVERMRARRSASRASELPARAVPVERRGGGDSGQGRHVAGRSVAAPAEEREGLDAQLPGERADVREQAPGLGRAAQPRARYDGPRLRAQRPNGTSDSGGIPRSPRAMPPARSRPARRPRRRRAGTSGGPGRTRASGMSAAPSTLVARANGGGAHVRAGRGGAPSVTGGAY